MVDPDGRGPFSVYCDMQTDGGGWTVFQRRRDGSVNFFRSWDDYKNGFGDISGEFWLGNEHIHRLTKHTSVLRVDLEDWVGDKAFAKYGQFRLGNESTKYTLVAKSYSGTAGNSLSYHDGMKFSTTDSDNDKKNDNCAVSKVGAWWYNSCEDSNLNGQHGKSQDDTKGMTWYHWKDNFMKVKGSELKLKPKTD